MMVISWSAICASSVCKARPDNQHC
jgi:hypothetical protein